MYRAEAAKSGGEPDVSAIGSLNETSLHAALKAAVAPPGSRFEVEVEGYVVDVAAPDLIIEVQTRGLGKLKPKLAVLLPSTRVRVVVPIAERLYLVKESPQGSTRRLSPKRGSRLSLFAELVSLPTLLEHPNAEIELLLTEQLEYRRHQAGGSWRRRGWVTSGRELIAITGRTLLLSPRDLLALLPAGLTAPFTTADIAREARVTARLAQQTAYCLLHLGLVTPVGKQGNRRVYAWPEGAEGEAPSIATPAAASAASSVAGSGSTTAPERR